MSKRLIAAIGGILAGLTLAALTAGTLLAQRPPSSPGPATAPPSHEQMHQMIDAMHGAGTSERMHEALGADADRLIDQCVAMMAMMAMMQGMGGMSMPPMESMGGMMGGMAGTPPTHEQMHQAIDAMMGAGFAERLHAAMSGSDHQLEQCVAMMAMMRSMGSMMGR
ncbi:MAG: hypothetical protein ACRDJE_27085 [Dehalococcoidia bacterium]